MERMRGISEVLAELADDAPEVKLAAKLSKPCKHGSLPALCRYEKCRRGE
jgi:hypothetical protein